MAPRTWPQRLHSLSGVVPVGAFLVFHLSTNAAAAGGADAFNAAARRLQQMPLAIAAEILLIGVPLFFHGIYGLFKTAGERAGQGRPGRLARPLAIAQRVTGVWLFAFILFHLWTARLVQIHDHGSLDLFRLMQSLLASPWIRAVYAAGLLSATFHFSSGLWTFSQTWNLARSSASRGAVAAAAAALFVALSALGLRSIAAFRL